MRTTYKISSDNTPAKYALGDLAKRIMFLAWKHCGKPTGMGILQDRGPHQSEDSVWEAMFNREDYLYAERNKPTSVYADYVMGRMMKLGIDWDLDTQTIMLSGHAGDRYDPDWHAFAHAFTGPSDLLNAAIKDLDWDVNTEVITSQ